MAISDTVELLKMYNKPELWDSVSLYEDVEIALEKITTPTVQLIERERFVLSEITRGLLEVIDETLNNTTDEGQKDALLSTITNVLQFLQFLDEGASS